MRKASIKNVKLSRWVNRAVPRFLVEPLEVRQLLSTVTWTGAGNDHLWANGLNWSTGLEPQLNDDVVIPNVDAAPIKAQPAVDTTIHSLTSAMPVQIVGNLTITGTATFNAGLDVLGRTLLIQGNTWASSFSEESGFFGGNGKLTVFSAATWSGGTIALGQLNVSNGIAISGTNAGAPAGLAGGTLNLPAGTSNSFTGTLTMSNGATLANAGTLTLNAATFTTGGTGTATEMLLNTGTINSITPGQFPGTTIGNRNPGTDPLTLRNSGTININNGGLTVINPDDGNTTGAFNTAFGTKLEFDSAFSFQGPAAIMGAGAVMFNGTGNTIAGTIQVGSTSVNGSLTLLESSTFDALGDLAIRGSVLSTRTGNLELRSLNLGVGSLTTAGTLTIDSTFIWTSGSLSAVNTYAYGGMTVGFGANLNGGILTNGVGQTATFNAAQLTLQGASRFSNGGTMNLLNSTIVANSIGASVLNSGAIISQNSGSFPSIFNTGAVAVQSGTLTPGQGSMSIGGTYYVAAGATLILQGNTTFSTGSEISGDGTVQFSQGITNVNGSYAVTGTTYFAAGTVNFAQAVTSFGAIQNDTITGNVNFFGPTPLIDANLTVQGQVNFGANSYAFDSLNVIFGGIQGSGTLTVQNQFNWSAGSISGLIVLADGGIGFNGTTTCALNNATLVNAAGQTALFSTGVLVTLTLNGSATFENDGTLIIYRGAINGPSSLGPTGTLINHGLIQVTAPAYNASIGTGVIFFNDGTIDVINGLLTLNADILATTAGAGAINVTGELDLKGAQNLNGSALSITNGGIVRALTAGATNQISSVAITNGTLDLNQSTLFISYAGAPDPLETIRGYLQNGYNGGLWTGAPTGTSGVVSSSAAAANAVHNTAIGYADSAEGLVALPANTIELKYTLYGDTGLTGTVGFTDFMRMTQHYTMTGMTWGNGDFNYDGTVDTNDFNLLKPNYGQSLPAPTPAMTPIVIAPVTSTPPSLVTHPTPGSSSGLVDTTAPSKTKTRAVKGHSSKKR